MSDQFTTKKVDIVGFTEAQRKAELDKHKTKLMAQGGEFIEYHDNGVMGSFALFKLPKNVARNAQVVQLLVGGFIGVPLLILLLAAAIRGCGGSSSEPTAASTAMATQQKQKSSKVDSVAYAQEIKSLVGQEIQSADVYIKDEGYSQWMFVTVSYKDWRSISVQDRKELVALLLRQMRETYKDSSGLSVSVLINERQILAEGRWSFMSDKPEVELIGE